MAEMGGQCVPSKMEKANFIDKGDPYEKNARYTCAYLNLMCCAGSG